jgi:hypothetical protein
MGPHDAVRAGVTRLGFVLSVVDPREDPKGRAELTRGEHDKDVHGIAGARGGQPHGPLDPGGPQDGVARGVPVHGEVSGSACGRTGLRVQVDHHHHDACMGEVRGDLLARAAIARNDHVPLQRLQTLLLARRLELALQVAGESVPRSLPERPRRDAHAHANQGHREEASYGAQGVDLSVADGRERDGDHPRGVQPVPALEETVAQRPHHRHAPQREDRRAEARDDEMDARAHVTCPQDGVWS